LAKIIANDAAGLLDHLLIESADVLGYSMGALIARFMTVTHPKKVRSVVFGGLGTALKNGVGDSWERIIRNFHSSGRKSVSDLEERYSSLTAANRDVEALAACMYVLRETLSSIQLATVQSPVLVAVGEKDEFAGSAHALASIIPASDVLILPGLDHTSTITSTLFQHTVIQFFCDR
jgi:pimeloyl-ACP methyl ester carboxylesterase